MKTLFFLISFLLGLLPLILSAAERHVIFFSLQGSIKIIEIPRVLDKLARLFNSVLKVRIKLLA